MKAEIRISRMKEFCYNPHIEMQGLTNFENLYLKSMRDFGREISMIDYPDFQRKSKTSVDIRSFDKSKDHYLLWTGGKESLLTSKILDYYDVEYKTVTFVESERGGIDFSGGTKDFINSGKLKPEYIFTSNVVADLATNSWGASVPILYYYILRMSQEFPDSIFWIGSEYTSCLARYKVKFALDQSDLLFDEINNDKDIDCTVYSCVNCLREFDIYRIVRSEFNYDPVYSQYNQGIKKKQRIDIWEKYYDLLNTIESAVDKDFIRMELNHIPIGIRLMDSVVYDFRLNIAEFLRTLKSFDRYR